MSLHVRNYALIGLLFAATMLLSREAVEILTQGFGGSAEHAETLIALSGIVIIFALGFLVYELAKPTVIPSFVLAVFFGIATRDVMLNLLSDPIFLSTIITIGAVLILFGGGLDTPFQKFKDLLGPILTLSLFGTLLTAFLLSLLFISIKWQLGIDLPLPAIILLGAALASTDPAAIIPSFERLHFRKPRVKHIAISESAINDVVGAVLFTIFLSLFLTGFKPASAFQAYATLLTIENAITIGLTLAIGLAFGLLGYMILQIWSTWKARVQTEEGSDAALFLAVPFFAFTGASILGGSGFLATFLASLLFKVRTHTRHVEHYFNHTIEGFMKPIIFILLGALVDPVALWEVADIGIIMGFFFIFVLRPLVVLISLLPFTFTRHKLTLQELAFLSFVRETGVIPAVLLISAFLTGLPGSDTMLAIGLWIMLMTLIIQPPLTPLLARKLGIATTDSPLPIRKHSGPVAVLCSRGYSFPQRLETVVDWALNHSVDNVILLHCAEERYSPEFFEEVHTRANELFAHINQKLTAEGKRELNFEFIGGPGLLQENIETLIAKGDVSIIFVGNRMLDYRIEDVKKLKVPFYFMT